jgi:peptidoglycan hydrolase-like protein with peptidoglycan-binding domain
VEAGEIRREPGKGSIVKSVIQSSIVLFGMLPLIGACGAAEDHGDPTVQAATDETLPLGRGARGELVREANEYLSAFGYLPNQSLSALFPGFRPIVSTSPSAPDVFDASTEAALQKFQENFGLPIDGKLTADVRTFMEGPRCGTPDTDRAARALTDKWALLGGRWNKTNITYRFASPNDPLPGQNLATTKASIRLAFSAWQAVTNLTFSEVMSGGDIVIEYVDFETPGVLGLGGLSPNVVFQIENDEDEVTWSVALLRNVATHELGHVLGLHHSSLGDDTISSPMMWPKTTGRTTLDEDDIIAGNSLYNTWEQLSGSATDIGANTLAGVGSNGDSVWILGASLFSDGYDAYQWTGSVFEKRTGKRGMRIDVDNTGKAWMIGRDSRIYRWSGSSWSEVPGGGLGTDIGIGANGGVFIIGTDGNAWSLASGGSGWNSTNGPGNAVAIDVDRNGKPWVVKSNQQVWSRTGSNDSWVQNAALAFDIGMGGNADVFGDPSAYRWVIGSDNHPWVEDVQPAWTGCSGNCSAPAANTWVQVNGTATRIAVGRKGRAYLVNSSGNIYRRREMQ